MDGAGLERVREYKYLGVWLSDALGWSSHVSKVVQRASMHVGIIHRTFYQHSTEETLLKLFLVHVRPLLEYPSQVWDPHQKTLIDSLESAEVWTENV